MAIRIYTLLAGLGFANLIESEAGMYLVDTGSPGTESVVLRKMRSLGRLDLRLIFITHAHMDHYGSAFALRRLTGAPIAIHPLDAPAMSSGKTLLGDTRAQGKLFPFLLPLVERIRPVAPTQADRLFADGETLSEFGLEATVVHTPGHTPGHCCLIVDGDIDVAPYGSSNGGSARRVAFAADLIQRSPVPSLQRLCAVDWAALPGSLARLCQYRPEWVYTGHRKEPLRGTALNEL